MKCRKCHYTMEKDYESRTATCPICGRTVSYKTKADKKRGYRYYPDAGDYETISPFAWFFGGAIFWGIIVLIVAIIIGILLLTGVFRDGFWAGLGNIGMFFVNLVWTIIKFIATTVWTVIKFIGTTIWSGLTALFHLIFG